MTDYYKQHEAEWILGTDPRPTNWLNYGLCSPPATMAHDQREAGIKPAISRGEHSWLDYLPLGKTHRLYHGLMMAIALMVLWKVRRLK